MKPIEFKEQNVVFAENQDPYIPLPAFRCDTPHGEVLSCWKMSIRERIVAFLTGKIWVWQITFNKPLQPQLITVEHPFLKKVR